MRELYNIFDLLKFFKKQNVLVPYPDWLEEYFNQDSTFLGRKGLLDLFWRGCWFGSTLRSNFEKIQHIFGANCISKYIIDKE